MNQSLLFYDGEIITMTAAKPRAVLVENGKIAEHWDVMETIADPSTWQNDNGKF